MHLVATLLSGILLPLALPNDLSLSGNPLIGMFCLTPLFFALYRSRTVGEGVKLTALFGGLSTFLSNYWLMFFKDYAFLTIGAVTIAYCGVYALWGGILWRLSRPHPLRALYIASGWTLFEYFKSIGYLAYPWGLIVYPFNDILPLLQVSDIGGVWLLSFLFALWNAVWVEAILHTPDLRRYAGFAASLTLVFLGYGLFRIHSPIPQETALRTVLVQQNMDPWETGKEVENLRTLMDLSSRGMRKLGDPADLVVWSESSLPRPFPENLSFYRRTPPEEPFTQFLERQATSFLMGTPVVKYRENKREYQNGAVLVDGKGRVLDTYGKRHPVPMAEHIPFYELPVVRRFFRNVVGIEGIWALGEKETLFSVKNSSGKEVRFGVPICFEDAFPYLCRSFILKGADLLINLTNDAWSRRKSAQTQHFVVARFRSIEMKRVLVRATNGGVTCVIGPYGEVIASLPMFEADALSVVVPIYKEPTFTLYTQWGDWFPLLLFFCLLPVFFTIRRRSET